MIRQVVSQVDWVGPTCLALLLFAAVFAGVWLWVYRRSSGETYRRMGEMPLSEG